MGCFNSKDDFPTQEVMVAVAGTASGKLPKAELKRVLVDEERESGRTSSQNDEIPRVVIHKDSATAAQEQAAAAAAASGSAEGKKAGGESPRIEGNATRRDGAADETNRGGEVERTAVGQAPMEQGKDESATRTLEEKGEGERSIVVVEGDPSEDVPRVVVHRDPQEAQESAASKVVAPVEDTGKLPARDPRPETPALPVSAEVGSKGLQEAATELRAALAGVENNGEKDTLAAEEEHNALAAPAVSVLPIVAEPGL